MATRIRDATDEDWPAIWPFFQSIVDAERTFPYPAGMSADQGRATWMVNAPGRTTVAVDDGDVLGSAHMEANRTGRGSHVATASFMVAPAHEGRGVGRALATDAIAWARDRGFRGMQFNAVVERNTRAVGLYQSLGFQIVGTVPEAFHHPDDGFVGLHVMYLPLT